MEIFAKTAAILARALLVLGGAAVALMVAVISVDVILKAATGRSIPGTLEATTYYFMPLAALAAIAVEQRDRHHIAVELFSRSLPVRARAALDFCAGALTLALMLAIGIYSLADAVRKTAAGDYVFVGFFDLPTWPARWIVPAVSFAFAAVSLVQLTESLRILRRRGPLPSGAA